MKRKSTMFHCSKLEIKKILGIDYFQFMFKI